MEEYVLASAQVVYECPEKQVLMGLTATRGELC